MFFEGGVILLLYAWYGGFQLELTYLSTHTELWWSRQESRQSVRGDTEFDTVIIGIREKNPLLTIREFNDTQSLKHWASIDHGLTLTSPLSTPVSNPRMILTAPIHPVENFSQSTYTLRHIL